MLSSNLSTNPLTLMVVQHRAGRIIIIALRILSKILRYRRQLVIKALLLKIRIRVLAAEIFIIFTVLANLAVQIDLKEYRQRNRPLIYLTTILQGPIQT